MKNLLQNLLVALSFGLCALCAWQWYVQAQLHMQGESLQQTLLKQSEDIQTQTNRIKNMEAEIAGLSTRVEELKATVQSNKLVFVKQDHEISMLRGTAGVLSNEIDQYKEIVNKMEAKLKSAADGITRQNEAIIKIAKDRDEAITRANDTMKERNAIVEKYNSLVLRWNQLQTNAPVPAEKQ